MMLRGKLRFRHVPATFILVRQDKLNQTNAVWIVDPPRNLPAHPVKPEPWGLVKRFLAFERQHQLPIVMPEAPDRSQKVVSMLKCSVIETINRAPFWVIGIVQNKSANSAYRLHRETMILSACGYTSCCFQATSMSTSPSKKGKTYTWSLQHILAGRCFTASTATANCAPQSPHHDLPTIKRSSSSVSFRGSAST